MTRVRAFVDRWQPFAITRTAPTFESFPTLVSGGIFAPSRTVTGTIVAAQAVGQKHRSAFQRVFARARRSRDAVGPTLFDAMSLWLHDTVFAVVDDTLARKRGLKIFAVGMHRNTSRHTEKEIDCRPYCVWRKQIPGIFEIPGILTRRSDRN